MTTVWLRDGTSRETTPEEARQLYLAGQGAFAPGTYSIVGADGQRKSVDNKQLQTELVGGSRFTTADEDEHDKLVDSWDSVGGALITGLANVASTATLGATDAIGSAISDDFAESRRAMDEANPGTALAADVLTEGAILLSTLGGATVARQGAKLGIRSALGSTPAGFVAKRATGALEASLAGAGIGRTALRTAAQGSMEAALFSAGQAVSELSIQEDNLEAEHLYAQLSNVAASTALGGGLGGALGLVGSSVAQVAGGTSRLAKKFIPGLSGLEEGLKKTELDTVGQHSTWADDIASDPTPRPDRVQESLDAFGNRDARRLTAEKEATDALTEVRQWEANANARATTDPAASQLPGLADDFEKGGLTDQASFQRLVDADEDFARAANTSVGFDKSQVKEATRLNKDLGNDLTTVDELQRLWHGGPGTAPKVPTSEVGTKLAEQQTKILGRQKGNTLEEARAGLTDAKAALSELQREESILVAKDKLRRINDGMPPPKERTAQHKTMLREAKQQVDAARIEQKRNLTAARELVRESDGIVKAHRDMGDLNRKMAADVRKTTGRVKPTKAQQQKLNNRYEVDIDARERALRARGHNVDDLDALKDKLLSQQGQARKIMDDVSGGAGLRLTKAEKAGRTVLRTITSDYMEARGKILRRNILDSRDGAKLFQVIHAYKRDLGAVAAQSSKADASVKALARDLYDDALKLLRDGDVVGTVRAEKAGRFDDGITTYYDNRGGLRGMTTGRKRVKGAMSDEAAAVIDPDGVNGWAETGVGDPAAMRARRGTWGKQDNDFFEQGVRDEITGLRGLADAYDSHAVMSPEAIAQGRRLIDNLESKYKNLIRLELDSENMALQFGVFRDADAAHKAAQINPIEKQAGLAAGVGGALAGHGIASILTGAATTAVLAAGSAAPTVVSRFAATAGGMATMQKSIAASRTAVTNAVTAMVTGSRVARQATARAAGGGTTVSPRKEFEQTVEIIEEYQLDPPAALDRAFQRTQPMSTITPDTAKRFGTQVVRAMEEAVKAMPDLPDAGPYGAQDKAARLKRVPRTHVAKFNARIKGLMNPMAVLDDMANGIFVPEAIEGLKVSSPALFAAMQQEVQDQLVDAGRPPTFARSVNLSKMLGLRLHPTLKTIRISAIQQVARGAEGSESPEPVTGSATRAPDLAESFSTRSEQIAGTARG